MHKLQLQRACRSTNFVPLAALALACAACAPLALAGAPAQPLRYQVVASHPHDVGAFTQGLAVLDGELLESRGLYGHSALTIGSLKTGVARKRVDLDARYFGEGIAVAGDRIVQLTWQSGIAFLYDRQLQRTGELRYRGEGWGLAYDGTHWLMSDGSDRIAVRNADDFYLEREFKVTDGGRPVEQLNELEFARGRLYANVWMSDRVAVIDPASGAVEGWLDFAVLRKGFRKPPGWDEGAHVLNGIAYDARTGHFLVTGKCWPVLYEVRLLPR